MYLTIVPMASSLASHSFTAVFYGSIITMHENSSPKFKLSKMQFILYSKCQGVLHFKSAGHL